MKHVEKAAESSLFNPQDICWDSVALLREAIKEGEPTMIDSIIRDIVEYTSNLERWGDMCVTLLEGQVKSMAEGTWEKAQEVIDGWDETRAG